MISNYAVVVAGIVVNVIAWDGKSPFDNHEKCDLIKTEEGVTIGWEYSDGQFKQSVETKLSPDEIAAERLSVAVLEYSKATLKINALSEQIADEDWLGEGDEALRGELSGWIKYRKEIRLYIDSGDGSSVLPTPP